LRWAELGTVYRYERSGVLHGLMRVRGFTQDDAHIFCLPTQIAGEILGVLNLTEKILSDFGFRVGIILKIRAVVLSMVLRSILKLKMLSDVLGNVLLSR